MAIFVLTQDRKVRIEVGYGLEGQLTDAQSGRIIREDFAPRMRTGDGDGAVTAAVGGVLRALGGESGAPPEASPGRPVSKWQLVGMAVIGLLLLLFVITHPRAALWMLFTMASGGRGGSSGWSGGSGGGGFSGGGGRSGGGGASGSW